MKKFADLSKSQKTFVVRMLEVCPQYKEKAELTLKELHVAYYMLRDQRGVTNEKIGFPIWLQKTNTVARGTYQMPYPTAAELSAYAKEMATPTAAKAPKAKATKAPKAKATKAPKVAKATPVKTKKTVSDVIAESEPFDQDTEDFNQILRENGIEV